jgi:hypothetical protein
MRQLLQDHLDPRKIREEQQARENPGPAEGPETGSGQLVPG